ncbi:MAG: hypothetical protein QF886_11010, partial [Planctomycetota bacterium]|nr:hypothetical protein [Planctomycetota bacterium]
RLKKDTVDTRASVTRAFLLVYGRKPDATELNESADFIEENNLAAFCIALFNSNEFLFIL